MKAPPGIEADSGSVRFHRVGKIEFWMTALNRIFLLVGGQPIFPSLQGGSVIKYDDPTFVASPAVTEALRGFLHRQREIRMDWPTLEEDEIAFQFS